MLLNNPTRSPVTTKVQFNSGELDMPLMMGELVLARYIGGQGKGKHTFVGQVSGRNYDRIKFGSLVYADPRDARYDHEVGSSPLIRVVVNQGADVPAPKILTPDVVEKVEMVEREPTKFDGEREPEDVVDIQQMSIKDIKLLDVTAEQAGKLLDQEKSGRNRAGAIQYLKSLTENKE